MGMELSGESQKLAEKLAEATGEALGGAVVTALGERLQRERALTDEELEAKWLAIGAENRRRFPDMPGSADIDAMLYDPESGLPIEDGSDFAQTDVLIA